MGTDTTNATAGRCAGLVPKPGAPGGVVCIALHLAIAFWLSIQVAVAEPAAETQPPAEEAAKALTARVEALEKLAKGALPEIPLDSLLGVSLDDDSAMIERDNEARQEHRRLMIAMNQAERLQNKSEAEQQLLRDQILALEFERKVLALPIEVRERLVEESYNRSAPSAPVQQAPQPEPVEPEKPVAAAQVPANSGATQPTSSTVQPAAHTRDKRPWLSEILTLMLGALALIAVLACKDVAASLLGGLILFLQHPFRVGHRVEIGGVEGRVTEMGLLSVRVLGPQHRSISIPNSEFLTKHVAASPPSGILTSFQVDFYLHPQDDIAHAKRIILEVIQSTRGAEASEGQGGIFVSQVPVNGLVMVRLRTKVSVTGTHPEQELASELSERVLARLRGGGVPEPLDKTDQSRSKTTPS